jgi:hypothetical protein
MPRIRIHNLSSTLDGYSPSHLHKELPSSKPWNRIGGLKCVTGESGAVLTLNFYFYFFNICHYKKKKINKIMKVRKLQNLPLFQFFLKK